MGLQHTWASVQAHEGVGGGGRGGGGVSGICECRQGMTCDIMPCHDCEVIHAPHFHAHKPNQIELKSTKREARS